jgi:hypothetical protein
MPSGGVEPPSPSVTIESILHSPREPPWSTTAFLHSLLDDLVGHQLRRKKEATIVLCALQCRREGSNLRVPSEARNKYRWTGRPPRSTAACIQISDSTISEQVTMCKCSAHMHRIFERWVAPAVNRNFLCLRFSGQFTSRNKEKIEIKPVHAPGGIEP